MDGKGINKNSLLGAPCSLLLSIPLPNIPLTTSCVVIHPESPFWHRFPRVRFLAEEEAGAVEMEISQR